MSSPTLAEIGSALRVRMAQAVEASGIDAIIVPPSEDGDPDAGDILVLHAINPGEVSGAELGKGLAVQGGVYSVTLSYPRDSLDRANETWALAQKLMDAFRREDLPAGESTVFVEDPYTTNVGVTPDGRMSLMVTVPWWSWTGE